MDIVDFKKIDDTFNEVEFLAKVDNTFIMILSAIMTNDLKKVKHKLSDSLYSKYEDYINKLNDNNLIQLYDELNVKSSDIIKIYEDNDSYYIDVLLVSRYMDYRIDKTTKKYVDGINDRRIEKNNILVFKKYKNVSDSSIIKKCPNCGNSISINESGFCEYCHGTYDLVNHDWVLWDLK